MLYALTIGPAAVAGGLAAPGGPTGRVGDFRGEPVSFYLTRRTGNR